MPPRSRPGGSLLSSSLRRSRALPVPQRAPSAWAKAALGDLSSLEGAQLRLADKNMEISGNPPPSFKILNAFIDPQLATILDDSGFELGADRGELVTLIRAREEAQAALTEAAAAAKAREAEVTARTTSTDPVISGTPPRR